MTTPRSVDQPDLINAHSTKDNSMKSPSVASPLVTNPPVTSAPPVVTSSAPTAFTIEFDGCSKKRNSSAPKSMRVKSYLAPSLADLKNESKTHSKGKYLYVS